MSNKGTGGLVVGIVEKGWAKPKQQKGRVKGESKNIISLFAPTDNHEENLKAYIAEAKKLHGPTFNYSVDWEKHAWDIRGFTSTTNARKVTNKANILFTGKNGRGAKVKVAKDDQVPFNEPFGSFAKAYITDRHNQKPKTHSNHMIAMNALRYLYEVLPDRSSPCITQLVPEHFNMAIKDALNQEQPSTLYITGGQLAALSATLVEGRLTPILEEWKNPIPRSYKHGGASQNRGSKKAKQERSEKLPKTDVLIFLAALWNHYDEIEERDKSLVCMSVILMLCGLRMDEFVGLDINCIPSREEFEAQDLELDPESGTYARILRIRVLAKKKAHWDEKIVPPCAVDVIYEAVERLKDLSAPHRRTARMMIEEGKWDRFASFDDDVYLSTKELKDLLGFPNHSNTITTLERYGAMRDPNAPPKKTRFRVGDIHEAFCDAYRERIRPILNGFGEEGLSIPVWGFLTLRYQDQYTPKERLNVFAEPLTGTIVQDFFRGRDYQTRTGKEDRRKASVFERYSFSEIDEVLNTISSHQFRHLLNTIMQESDMFSQEDIAKNFLRKDTQDNKAYNHQIEPSKYAERNRDFQANMLVKLNLNADEAQNAIRKFPLLSYEELQRDLDESGSYHFMDIGRCRHDYTQGPCGMHYMCLRGCIKYRRKKGDPIEVERITFRRDQTQAQMQLAKEDADDEFTGANNWYLNHQELVDGCNTSLAIEADDRFEVGEIVQVFPNGINCCEEAEG